MGCASSQTFKRKKLETILSYDEKEDIRLGRVYFFKMRKEQDNFIAKEISEEQRDFLQRNKIFFDSIFQKYKQIIIKIKGFDSEMICVTSNGCGKTVDYVKIDYYSKDLNLDVKMRIFQEVQYKENELWNFLFVAIFSLSILENNNVRIQPLQRSQFLIQNKKLRYFCPNLFHFTNQIMLQENQKEKQFIERREELITIFYSLLLLIDNTDENLINSKSKNLINKFEANDTQLSTKLSKFIKEGLLNQHIKDFNEMKKILSEIYFDNDKENNFMMNQMKIFHSNSNQLNYLQWEKILIMSKNFFKYPMITYNIWIATNLCSLKNFFYCMSKNQELWQIFLLIVRNQRKGLKNLMDFYAI